VKRISQNESALRYRFAAFDHRRHHPADLPLFKQINVKAFIAGRALAGAAHPQQVAQAFHSQIRDIWGE
jgi:hypothetical protein